VDKLLGFGDNLSPPEKPVDNLSTGNGDNLYYLSPVQKSCG